MLLALAQQTAPTATPFEHYLPYLVAMFFGIDRVLMYLKSRGIDLTKMSETLSEIRDDTKRTVEWYSPELSNSVKTLSSEMASSLKDLANSVTELTRLIGEYRLELRETKSAVSRIESKVCAP